MIQGCEAPVKVLLNEAGLPAVLIKRHNIDFISTLCTTDGNHQGASLANRFVLRMLYGRQRMEYVNIQIVKVVTVVEIFGVKMVGRPIS